MEPPADTRYRAACALIDQLVRAGHEAYLVGGTVRDLLLKRAPHDYDIVTSAPPDVTQRLFPHHTTVGLPFGVVGVVIGTDVIDVATAREETDYRDRRRPSRVRWSSLDADVRRRDFTVNGLLLDPASHEVVDHVDGRRDLALGLIRTIGEPANRFHEDPLRLLRAARLKNELVFQYDPATYRAMAPLAAEVAHVAPERIRTELDRMWALPSRAEALSDLDALGLLAVVLPEVAALHGVPQPRRYHREGDVFAHTHAALAALPKEAPLTLVWATLLHDVAKPAVLAFEPSETDRGIRTPAHAERSAELARAILDRLHCTKLDRETVTWLIAHHMSLKDIEAMRPVKRERYLTHPDFPLLLELHRADVLGTDPSDLSLYEHDLALYRAMQHAHGLATVQAPPLVTGSQLMDELGLPESDRIGWLLDELRDAQLRGQVTTRQAALILARRLIAGKN